LIDSDRYVRFLKITVRKFSRTAAKLFSTADVRALWWFYCDEFTVWRVNGLSASYRCFLKYLTTLNNYYSLKLFLLFRVKCISMERTKKR